MGKEHVWWGVWTHIRSCLIWITAWSMCLIFLWYKLKEYAFHVLPPASKSDYAFSKIKIIRVELKCFRNFQHATLPPLCSESNKDFTDSEQANCSLGLTGCWAFTATCFCSLGLNLNPEKLTWTSPEKILHSQRQTSTEPPGSSRASLVGLDASISLPEPVILLEA